MTRVFHALEKGYFPEFPANKFGELNRYIVLNFICKFYNKYKNDLAAILITPLGMN